MICVYCESKTQVTNSRLQKKQNSVWRRRKCTGCKAVFTSVESVDLSSSILVKHDEKRSEPFQRDKMLVSVYDSLKHRKTATSDATALTNTIIGQMIRDNSDAIVNKDWVTDRVIYVLERFDPVAAVHYTAYYK